MSLPDTIFIFGLALVIFGPKKLPEIGRQLGKLMLEFRRASNEFKMQIEEELRAAEYADQQKQLAATAPAPTPVVEAATSTPVIRPPSDGETVSTESPASRVIPVAEEVPTLEAAAAEHLELTPEARERLRDGAEHPEMTPDTLERLPEQATVHHD